MRKFVFILIIISVLVLQLHAQTDVFPEKVITERIDSLLDDVLFEGDFIQKVFGLKKEYQFLYLSTGFDNKTFYAGREIGVNQFNFSSQIFYLHTNGFYAGASGTYYDQLEPGYRTTSLVLGYGNNLKNFKALRYRASLNYYIMHDKDPEYEYAYFGSFNSGLTLKTKNVGTRVDASFLLGDEFNTQINWSAYAYIDIAKFGYRNKVRLEPEVSLLFGNDIAEFWLDEGYIDPLTNILYSSYYKETFGLMNLQMKLPLNVMIKNFDFEFAYKYNFPRTTGEITTYPNSSYFSFSIGYIFSL